MLLKGPLTPADLWSLVILALLLAALGFVGGSFRERHSVRERRRGDDESTPPEGRRGRKE